MKALLIFVALMAAFCVVGRIDYESQLAMAGNHREQMEGLGMGWWIVLVVVAGIVVWAICAVRETRRVLDQEGNLLREWDREWEDVQ